LCEIGGPDTIVNNPELCVHCEAAFCKECIDHYLKTNTNCPACNEIYRARKPGGNKFKALRLALESLKFKYEGKQHTHAEAYERA
jgi:hypothetical protein